MDEFLEIKCLDPQEQKKIVEEIETIIKEKKKQGILSNKEIKEIMEMKLHPLADILDVQSVYKSLKFED